MYVLQRVGFYVEKHNRINTTYPENDPEVSKFGEPGEPWIYFPRSDLTPIRIEVICGKDMKK